MKKIAILLILSVSLFSQQSFTCNYGTRAVCIDSYSKIVDSDSKCFDSYTCGYGGFTCKSDYDALVRKFNNNLDLYDSLVRKHNNNIEEYDTLIRKFNNNLTIYNDAEDCVAYASTLQEAQNCF